MILNVNALSRRCGPLVHVKIGGPRGRAIEWSQIEGEYQSAVAIHAMLAAAPLHRSDVCAGTAKAQCVLMQQNTQ
jgi:hypothetical protein